MPFVKLDCGILESSLWIERDVRDVFITVLLLAKPQVFRDAQPQIHIRSLKPTGWKVPPGEYGFVRAASTGIIDRSKVPVTAGLKALETLSSPESESRSPQFDGRRIARVAGGFVVLNYMRYRGQDDTNAERQARFRNRNRNGSNAVTAVTEPLLVTQADAEADVEADLSAPDLANQRDRDTGLDARARDRANGHALVKHQPDLFNQFWACYPKHEREVEAETAFDLLRPSAELVARMISTLSWQVNSPEWLEKNGRFIPRAAKWLNEKRWLDEPPQKLSSDEAQIQRVAERMRKAGTLR